ncbi:hypothetical protein [Rummeliibacillus stabekisii]
MDCYCMYCQSKDVTIIKEVTLSIIKEEIRHTARCNNCHRIFVYLTYKIS